MTSDHTGTVNSNIYLVKSPLLLHKCRKLCFFNRFNKLEFASLKTYMYSIQYSYDFNKIKSSLYYKIVFYIQCKQQVWPSYIIICQLHVQDSWNLFWGFKNSCADKLFHYEAIRLKSAVLICYPLESGSVSEHLVLITLSMKNM